MNRTFRVALCIALISSHVDERASAATNPPAAPAIALTNAPATIPPLIATIEQLVALRSSLQKQLADIRKEIDKSPAGSQREALQQEAERVVARITTLDDQIQTLAAGANAGTFDQANEETLDFQQEVVRLVRPLLEQLRRASEQPRMEESLRGAIEKTRERLYIAGRASDKVTELLAKGGFGRDGRRALEEIRDRWENRRKEAASQLEVSQIQLRQMLDQKKPMIESLTGMIRNFFRMRGKNLALAAVVAVIVFLLFRLLHARLRRSSTRFARLQDSFYSRVANLALHVLSALVAIIAAMVVLYYAGDWVLLGLLILVLLGLVLAARSSFPLFIDDIKILLNLGGVREGERVVIDGLPYRIDKLDFLSTLSNPAMPGHVLRLPLRRLREMISRPSVEREPWFPCREDDWVILSDNTVAKIIMITPEIVSVVRIGGLHKTYQTGAFLALHPANLSRGFRVSTTFGIDYSHQAESTDTIPTAMEEHILRRLVETVGRDAVKNVRVLFSQAAPSSLDFDILADFDGEVAERYGVLRRCLQKFAVEAFNANGWTMRLPQIKVHAAEQPRPKTGS